MNFRISTVLCWALLVAIASATQNSQRNNGGFVFKDADAEIEGSGFDGEVNRDLESSGSGQGPPEDDDEDIDPISPDRKKIDQPPPVVEFVPKKTEVFPDNAPISPGKDKEFEGTTRSEDSHVIMSPKPEDRPTSFFSQPGILAAVIGGAVVGLLCAILVVMFIVYRMRKKDEGSYALGEPKQSPNSNSYSRGTSKEFYA